MTNAEAGRRVVVTRAGGSERLEVVAAAPPRPAPGEVLLANEAVGVAFADVLIREGLYPGVPLPATPGYEAVGRVLKVGAGVTAVEVGSRVAALTVHGGYASHVLVPAEDCVPVPQTLSSSEAAALVLNGLTAFQMLTRCVALGSTENVLIWGAAGGVGSILLDLARCFGVTAYGAASPSRLAFVAGKGGAPVDRMAGDVADQVRRLTGGVDAVFDGVGGPNVRTSLRALRPGGTVVMYGVQGALASGRRRPLKLVSTLVRTPVRSAHQILLGNVGLKGYLIEGWKRTHPDWSRRDLAEVFRLAAEGRIVPHIHAEMPLSEVRAAHDLMNTGAHQGMIVLLPQA